MTTDQMLASRIIVIGCPGSGKSTLSTKLGEKLNLPVYHLDDWQNVNPEEFRRVQHELMEKDKWILDGNFTKSIDSRAQKADTIIFLDFSKWIVCGRVFKRYFRDFKNGTSKFFETWGILRYIWNFPRTEILSIIEKHKEDRKIITVRNQSEVDALL